MRGRTQDDGSTPRDLRHDYWGVVLDAPDALALARFYAELLDWELASRDPSFATIRPPDGVGYLGFQTSPEYVPPVWPPVDGDQQMMLHLDFEVEISMLRSSTPSNSVRQRRHTNRRTRFESCWTRWVTRSVSTRTGKRAPYLVWLTGDRPHAVERDGMDLHELRDAIERDGVAWSAFLAQDYDAEQIVKDVDENGRERDASVGIRLAQELHHGTDHRSQICTALTTLGLQPPSIEVWDFGLDTGRIVEVLPP